MVTKCKLIILFERSPITDLPKKSVAIVPWKHSRRGVTVVFELGNRTDTGVPVFNDIVETRTQRNS